MFVLLQFADAVDLEGHSAAGGQMMQRRFIGLEADATDGLERKEAFYIRGRLTGSNVDEAANTPARGTKLNQLLKNNKDIFVIFRYMFEKARTQNWEYFFFEYENLDVAISALATVTDQFLTPEEIQKVSTV